MREGIGKENCPLVSLGAIPSIDTSFLTFAIKSIVQGEDTQAPELSHTKPLLPSQTLRLFPPLLHTMRLLNTCTFGLEEFIGDSVSQYVILSHIWESQEVSFEDMGSGDATIKAGYAKIEGCCGQARADGYL